MEHRLVKIICIGLIGYFSSAFAYNDANTKQAMEQLRLLQQRLSVNNAATQNAANQAIATQPSPQPAAPQAVVASPPSRPLLPMLRPKPEHPVAQAGNNMQSTLPLPADKESIEEIAFNNAEQQLFPLTPKEVVSIHKAYNKNEYAKAATPGTPPRPIATSQFVNLSPGSTPPVIRLSQGFVSSLVFLDSTGAPWPIHAYDLGDPAAFNIQWDKKSNTLMIQSIKLYTYGNLAVRLHGLNTPVMLTLIPGQKAVDYRVDLRVQGYGPNAQHMPIEDGLPVLANDVLLHVLDGVPPAGSVRLVVSGGDARAWLLAERMFIRTNLTILSPGWLSSMTSADGMHAYEMQKSPVLLVSWHGKVMQLKVEGL